MIFRVRLFFICGFILISLLISAGALGDNTESADAKVLLMNALNRSDHLSLTNEPNQLSENIEGIILELEMAHDGFKNPSIIQSNLSDNAVTLADYAEFWILIEKAGGEMIQGSEYKKWGYDTLSANDSESYLIAYQNFADAKLHYQNAYDLYQESANVLGSIDPDIIITELPEASFPNKLVIEEILHRLQDNIRICSAYTHICNYSLLISDTGNTTQQQAEEEFNTGIGIMQSLISSPYVGEEAALIANSTLLNTLS